MIQERHAGLVNLISMVREKANKYIQQELDTIGHPELRPSHGTLLWILLSAPTPPTVKEIIKRTGKSKSTISVSLRNLAKHGYITISPNPNDCRGSVIVMTEKLENMKDDFSKIALDLNKLIATFLPQVELDALVDGLEKIDLGFSNVQERRKKNA